ncbi:uncharacterized protein LOC107052552 [Gallus gallus]|uniref:uncharacterized protein LOC107052552 n=1 Tax=Gallus gallus TaxID=9031 RepID=UPI001AE8DA0A|nr:uncharacterized protein LOC107052552 [Gallus gallus]XP_040521880.1 uncharacterized protein LOC107052552 [Gallus gallus]XP_040521881.1 uncharacterized protein LOC107052552 [Gallus gallus]
MKMTRYIKDTNATLGLKSYYVNPCDLLAGLSLFILSAEVQYNRRTNTFCRWREEPWVHGKDSIHLPQKPQLVVKQFTAQTFLWRSSCSRPASKQFSHCSIMLSCVKQHINHEDKVLLSNKAAFPSQVSKKKPQLSNQCLGIETAQHLSGAG